MNKPIKIEYTHPNAVYIEAIDERGFIVCVWVDNSCGDVSVTNYVKPKNN